MFVAGNPPPWKVLLFGMIRYEEAGVRRTKRKKPLTGGGDFQKKKGASSSSGLCKPTTRWGWSFWRVFLFLPPPRTETCRKRDHPETNNFLRSVCAKFVPATTSTLNPGAWCGEHRSQTHVCACLLDVVCSVYFSCSPYRARGSKLRQGEQQQNTFHVPLVGNAAAKWDISHKWSRHVTHRNKSHCTYKWIVTL